MKDYTISVYRSIIRSFHVDVEAESWEDARNKFHAMSDADLGEGYDKILDSDWEINEAYDD